MTPTNYRELAIWFALELVDMAKIMAKAIAFGMVMMGVLFISLNAPGPTTLYYTIVTSLFAAFFYLHFGPAQMRLLSSGGGEP